MKIKRKNVLPGMHLGPSRPEELRCGMCAVKCPRGGIRDANGIFTID